MWTKHTDFSLFPLFSTVSGKKDILYSNPIQQNFKNALPTVFLILQCQSVWRSLGWVFYMYLIHLEISVFFEEDHVDKKITYFTFYAQLVY